MELTWNARCQESIRKEKAEAEKCYGIRISQTEIYCAWCGKPATFFHTCPDMSPERREEIEGIKDEHERPVSPWKNIPEWQVELGIEFGVSKEEAFEKLFEWQEPIKTCLRCEFDKYVDYCPIYLVCEEAQNERHAEGNDNRGRTSQADEPKALRIELSETRKRAPLR